MIIKAQSKQKIEILENELQSCLIATRNPKKVDDRLNKALSVIRNLSLLYKSSSVEAKRKIISSIYPENLEFTGMEYRTTRVNSILGNILLITNRLSSGNNEKNDKKTAYHCIVTPMDDFSNFLKEYLLRIESIHEYFDSGNNPF